MIPILAGEAADTDLAVSSLKPELKRVVEVWYLLDATMAQKRKALRCRRERMMQLLALAESAICDRIGRR